MTKRYPVRILTALALSGASLLAANRKPVELVPPTEAMLAKVREALPSKCPVKPAANRNLLVFHRTDGFVHKSIPLGVETMRLLGEKTGAFKVEDSKDMEIFAPEKLKRFDAVLFLSTTHLDPSEPQRKALLDFVRGGKGIIGIHAATDNFYTWEEGARMMGGLFCEHPWTAKCTVQVKLDEPDHPINAVFGGKPFKVQDEIYQFKDPYSRTNQLVIASLDMNDPDTKAVKGGAPKKMVRTDGDFGVTWVRREGKGRVFYCSLGHNEGIYWDNRILQHYLAGIQYALGDYAVPDAPVQK